MGAATNLFRCDWITFKTFCFKSLVLVCAIKRTGSGVGYVRGRISTLVTPKIGSGPCAHAPTRRPKGHCIRRSESSKNSRLFRSKKQPLFITKTGKEIEDFFLFLAHCVFDRIPMISALTTVPRPEGKPEIAVLDGRLDGASVCIDGLDLGSCTDAPRSFQKLLRREGKELGLKTLADNFGFFGLLLFGS
ncbi:hypothetical protein CXB51_021780 [Gossypium anomalum]|uniref:Uncharacterized protein n=1 Tax=Gossypium anomalum TaxID=47600 RepID=A0A8J5Y8H0_9ROSI|nr:hypothetical protein CXB51_021780 [Gossypium anomalum]